MLADRQTDRQTDTVITMLRCVIGGGVISITTNETHVRLD